ncbi:MAG: Mov34/MPN/PAD-1 family protein [Hyphomicrobiales bacterium]
MCFAAGGKLIEVLLPRHVIEALSDLCRSGVHSNEQGGLLLGYRKDAALQVTAITLPQRWDRSTPTRFFRGAKGHRDLARCEWRRSEKKIDWLGEWHTHPTGSAVPSYVDRATWLSLAKHTRQTMAFLIFSKTDMYAGLQDCTPARLRQMQEIERSTDSILFGRPSLKPPVMQRLATSNDFRRVARDASK